MASPKLTVVERPARLFLPDVTGLTLLAAALAYAEAGWYLFPVKPGTKVPAIGNWDENSTRDAKRIRTWWRRNPDYGIALHVGRSGAVAFDFDHLTFAVVVEAGRGDIVEALASAGAINGTRTPEVSNDRAHYLFACEVGEFGNSAGDFGPYGEVRGNNGYIVVAPTPHPDAQAKGGQYRQIRTGELTPLPAVLRAVLAAPGKVAEPLSYAELEEWLDDDDETGCGTVGCKHSPKGQVAKFNAKVAAGASRYETMTKDVGPWGFREAAAGCYGRREVFDALVEAYEAVKPGHRNELYRGLRWAAAQAQAEPGDVHPDTADGVRLWRATDLRAAAAPNWLARGRLPRGAISLLVGDEGIGKSLLWVWIASAVTTGKPLPEFGIPERTPADVIVAVTEDDWSSTVRPRLEVVGADLGRIHVVCEEADGSGSPEFPRHLHLIATADPAPALVVVDAWLDTVPAGLSVRDPQQARQALHPWKELATVTDAAVLLLTHTNRVVSASARDKYGATGELRKKARMTLFAQVDDDGLLAVGPEKSNTAAPLPASRFRIDPVAVFAATEDSDGTVPRLVFVGDSDRTAREMVADALVPRPVTEDHPDPATLWLFGYLSDAAEADETVAPKDAVKAAADECNISRATLYRQFDRLKDAGLAVSVDSGGFPKTVRWQLTTPVVSPDAETTATTGDLTQQRETTETTGMTCTDTPSDVSSIPVVSRSEGDGPPYPPERETTETTAPTAASQQTDRAEGATDGR